MQRIPYNQQFLFHTLIQKDRKLFQITFRQWQLRLFVDILELSFLVICVFPSIENQQKQKLIYRGSLS